MRILASPARAELRPGDRIDSSPSPSDWKRSTARPRSFPRRRRARRALLSGFCLRPSPRLRRRWLVSPNVKPLPVITPILMGPRSSWNCDCDADCSGSQISAAQQTANRQMRGATVLFWDSYAAKYYDCQLRRQTSKKENVTKSEQEGLVAPERSD